MPEHHAEKGSCEFQDEAKHSGVGHVANGRVAVIVVTIVVRVRVRMVNVKVVVAVVVVVEEEKEGKE